jgi:putative hydrolase of HD superfamily
LRVLWDEFEEMETPESQFAASLDRLQPLMHNYLTGGKSWQEHGIVRAQVVKQNQHIAKGSQELWDFALSMIDDAVARGYLAP